MEKHYTLWTLLILIFPLALSAQHKWESTLFVGGANYQGDLVPDIYPYPKETNIALGILGRYYVRKRWALRLGATYAQLSGDDANFDDPAFTEGRRFSFTSHILESALLLEWEPFAGRRYPNPDSVVFKKLFSPYLFAGGALTISNPKTKFADYLNGESPPLVQQDRHVAFPEQIIAVPMGMGFKVDLSQRVALGLEGGTRYVPSDYLDGVSKSGNPKAKDWYVFAGATLTIRFFKHDEDHDGIPDREDRCPRTFGAISAKGCPDRDGDGTEDDDDLCPDLPGIKILAGCPDTDGDGLADREDSCPNNWGPECTNGCPDEDEDCVSDVIDECPTQCGLAYAQGCPDADGDKIKDSEDWCALLAGLSWKGGCPLLDTNGDGSRDEKPFCTIFVGILVAKEIQKKVELPAAALDWAQTGLFSVTGIHKR